MCIAQYLRILTVRQLIPIYYRGFQIVYTLAVLKHKFREFTKPEQQKQLSQIMFTDCYLYLIYELFVKRFVEIFVEVYICRCYIAVSKHKLKFKEVEFIAAT